jgi:hypothetical protein
MSKKVNDEVIEEVMEGEVIEDEVNIEDEIERLEALVKAQKSVNSDKKRKKRNILIGAGIGVAGILGGMYLMGRKAEKEREKQTFLRSFHFCLLK